MKISKFILDERIKRKLQETSIAVLGIFYIVCILEMILKIIITNEYNSSFDQRESLLSELLYKLIRLDFKMH